jgi:hypothetical protein
LYKKKEREPGAWGYNWVTLFLEDRVGHKADELAL